MAEYHYDESGNMAAYFLITFLLVVLVPLTISTPAVFSAYHVAFVALWNQTEPLRSALQSKRWPRKGVRALNA